MVVSAGSSDGKIVTAAISCVCNNVTAKSTDGKEMDNLMSLFMMVIQSIQGAQRFMNIGNQTNATDQALDNNLIW